MLSSAPESLPELSSPQKLESADSPEQASFSTADSSTGLHSPPLDSPSSSSAALPPEEKTTSIDNPEDIEVVQSSDEVAMENTANEPHHQPKGVEAMRRTPTPCRRRIPPTSSADRMLGEDEANARTPASCSKDVLSTCIGGTPLDSRFYYEHLREPTQQEVQDIRPDPLWSKHPRPRPPPSNIGYIEQTADYENLRFYQTSLDDPVGGRPAKRGELLIYDMGWGTVSPWSVLLFANGFYAIPRNGTVHSYAWSPFSVLNVEESHSSALAGHLAFSLSIIPHDTGFMFALSGRDAESRRRRWIDDMALTLRTYIKSLFPACTLAVEPLKEQPCTARRIVAGYLLVSEGGGLVSVPYVELQAHRDGEGLLVMYQSDQCDTRVASLPITANTFLHAKQAIDCSLFTVGHLRLCARTVEERNLWYRAISNVQVKCYNGAPDPTDEDLSTFREAVMERVRALELLEGVQRVMSGPGPSLPEVAPKLARVVANQPQRPLLTPAPAMSQPPADELETKSQPSKTREAATGHGAHQILREDAEDLRKGSNPEADDCNDTELGTKARCQKPPASAPGPGLHQPVSSRRPQAEALQRVIDVSLTRMSQGQLSI